MTIKNVWMMALLALLVGQLPPVSAAAGSWGRHVVVYRSGVVKSFALGVQPKDGACTDPAVAFEFNEQTDPANGNLTVAGAQGTTASGAIRVELSCVQAGVTMTQLNIPYQVRAQPSGVVIGLSPDSITSVTGGDIHVAVEVTTPSDVNRATVIDRGAGSYFAEENGSFFGGSIPGRQGVLDIEIEPNPFDQGLPTSSGGGAQETTEQDVANYCTNNASDPLCAALAKEGVSAVEVTSIVDAVSPQAATAVPNSVNQIAASQLGNISSRLADLVHGRNTGFSTSGLNLETSAGTLSLADVVSVLNAAGDDNNEERRTLLGGTRWGGWFNGTIGRGSRSRTAGNTGFDFDNYSVTGGVDYRFTDQFYAGVGLGYAQLDSDYGDRGGSLRGNTWSLHGYGVYVLPNDFSIDGSLSWARGNFDQRRSMWAIREIVEVDQGDALGSTDVNQLSGGIGVSWIHRGGGDEKAWTFMPQAQYQFVHTEIDGFVEHGCQQGSGTANYCLRFPEQNQVTRSLSMGAYLDRIFAKEQGVFRPYARALFFVDSGTGVRMLSAQFVTSAVPIRVLVDEPDRRYGTIELGMGFSRPVGTRVIDMNFGAMKIFGQDNFDQWAVRADFRVPF